MKGKLTMERYEERLMAAYVRGMARQNLPLLPPPLMETPLELLSAEEIEAIFHAGEAAGLKLYYFKKKELLPRVKAVLGFLRSVQPESLLDVGSGRGVFLFPFLTQFSWTQVTAADILPRRVQMLQAIADGGIENLTVLERNICQWTEEENLFDVVTLLEVLEHIPNVEQAIANAVRLTRRFVVVSVPSQPDDNPEHIHLLTRNILADQFTRAGCTKLHFDGVNGHLILVAGK